MTSKKIILLIFATMVTIALAVIAVVTSMKLREVATVPVAPNVPVSQPKAADGSYACQVSFTVTAPVTPTLTCTGLTASNTAPALNDTVTYTCAAAVTGMTGVTPTYEFRYKKPGDADFTAATSTGSTWSLLLDENGSYSVQCRANGGRQLVPSQLRFPPLLPPRLPAKREPVRLIVTVVPVCHVRAANV